MKRFEFALQRVTASEARRFGKLKFELKTLRNLKNTVLNRAVFKFSHLLLNGLKIVLIIKVILIY